MDVSNSLLTVARLLLRQGEDPRVYCYPQRGEDGWTVVVSIALGGIRISGTGGGSHVFEAFLKAIAELGEEILRESMNLPCRSGLAGGLFIGPTIERAKAELIERDAFFRHYREQIPFLPIDKNQPVALEGQFRVYELISAVPGYRVALVTKQHHELEGHEYIHFGTGANVRIDCAIRKAHEEYFSLKPFFVHNAKQIIRLVDKATNSTNPMLLHLMAAFDRRNLDLFSILCGEHSSMKKHRGLVAMNKHLRGWQVSRLKSPIRCLSYVRVINPNLYAIEFGKPEAVSDVQDPLYHPFW